MRGLRSIALVYAVLASTSAWATYVVPSGGVALSHGEGFRQITGQTTVAVGDSVIASPGGSAKIVYDDGCTEEVKPGDIATVKPASPCNPGAYVAPSHPARPYIIGAAVVGGVVTAAVLLGQNSSSGHKNKNKNAKPASP
jgi:hypothetical protein